MATTNLTLAERVALVEQQLAEIKVLLKEPAVKADPASARAMAVAAAAASVVAPVPTPKPQATAAKTAPAQQEGISPEIMAVISAAVTHFFGLRARIRHAHVIQRPTGVSPWAQQGRVFIQASHNLAHR